MCWVIENLRFKFNKWHDRKVLLESTEKNVETCMHFSYSWSILPAMHDIRDGHPGVTWTKSGVIIAAGGNNQPTLCASAEALLRPYFAQTAEMPAAQWHRLAPMRAARQNFSLCEVGQHILAVGGSDNHSGHAFVLWNSIAKVEALSLPPTPSFFLGSDGGRLGQWTTILPMTCDMQVFGLSVQPNGVIALGRQSCIHCFS